MLKQLFKLYLGQQGFNILAISDDGDPSTWQTSQMTGVADSLGGGTTTSGDVGFWADYINCFDDITMTLSYDTVAFPNITSLEWAPGGAALTFPTGWSKLTTEIHPTQLTPGAEVFTFTITWEACGVTKVQTGDFDIT